VTHEPFIKEIYPKGGEIPQRESILFIKILIRILFMKLRIKNKYLTTCHGKHVVLSSVLWLDAVHSLVV